MTDAADTDRAGGVPDDDPDDDADDDPSEPRLVSMRAAAQVLAEAGVPWQGARALLLTGVAGHGIRAGGAALFDARRVESLLSWPNVRPVGIERAFVARLAAGRLDVGVEAGRVREQARHGWKTDELTRLRLRLALEEQGYLPFVATVSGYVLLCADLVGLGGGGQSGTSFVLDTPGSWCRHYSSHRLWTGRGHHWTFWPAADATDALTTPTTEPPTARPTRRRRLELGMRVDPHALQQ